MTAEELVLAIVRGDIKNAEQLDSLAAQLPKDDLTLFDWGLALVTKALEIVVKHE